MSSESLSPSLVTVREAPRTPRESRPAEVADEPATAAVSAATRNLTPFCGRSPQLAERASLVGLTDREGLRRALVPYEDRQVRFAVHQTLAMARAGSVKSPIGWLVAKARQGDEAFFPPVSSFSPAPPLLEPTVEEDGPDPEAEAAVEALEASPGADGGELARIDALIRRAMPPSVAQKMFADASWLHVTRVMQWRAQHPRSTRLPPSKEGTT